MGNNFGVKVDQVKTSSQKTSDSEKSNTQSNAQKLAEQLFKSSSSSQPFQPEKEDKTSHEKDIKRESVPTESTNETPTSATLKENSNQNHSNNVEFRYVAKKFEAPFKPAKQGGGRTSSGQEPEVPFKLTIRGRKK